MRGHTASVICMVVVNRLMYTGSADCNAKCWVTEFGDCTRKYTGHKHSVICMKFDKGTREFRFERFLYVDLFLILIVLVFTGCGDGIIRAYDAKSGQLKRVFQGHEGAVNTIVIVGEKVYSGASDATLRVWDAKDISEDLLVDEEPPPAPTDTISSLERDLEKDHTIVPIPDEPGILDLDDDVEQPQEEEAEEPEDDEEEKEPSEKDEEEEDEDAKSSKAASEAEDNDEDEGGNDSD